MFQLNQTKLQFWMEEPNKFLKIKQKLYEFITYKWALFLTGGNNIIKSFPKWLGMKSYWKSFTIQSIKLGTPANIAIPDTHVSIVPNARATGMLYMKVHTMANTIFNAGVAALMTIALVDRGWIKPPITSARRPPTITHGQNATSCICMFFNCYYKAKLIISNSTLQ